MSRTGEWAGIHDNREKTEKVSLSQVSLCCPIDYSAAGDGLWDQRRSWFLDGFWQMLIILWIMGLFDWIFIDWYWVGHTKAWIIPGTEDLQPYIPTKVLIRKWVGTIVGYPLIAAMLAGIMTLM